VALAVHNSALRRLWGWVNTSSAIGEQQQADVSKCLAKMEAVLSLGVGLHDQVLSNPTFPWAKHWARGSNTLELAVGALISCGGGSVVPALRIIKAVIESWPQALPWKDRVGEGVDEPQLGLPFNHPTRSDVALFVNASHDLLEIVARAVVRLAQHDEQNGASATFGAQLKSCLDFLQAFAHYNDAFVIPQSIVQRLWTAVLDRGGRQEEMNALLTFVENLVVRGPAAGLFSSGPSSTGAERAAVERRSLCSLDTIKWTFTSLLCDVDGFVAAPCYGAPALACTEKLFRWLNAELGCLHEIQSNSFSITKPCSELFGTEVFYTIVLRCQSDDVAESAVRTLTWLPQRLCASLLAAGELVAVR
jgi:hypothetical protein